jgi:hypothetical protein
MITDMPGMKIGKRARHKFGQRVIYRTDGSPIRGIHRKERKEHKEILPRRASIILAP